MYGRSPRLALSVRYALGVYVFSCLCVAILFVALVSCTNNVCYGSVACVRVTRKGACNFFKYHHISAVRRLATCSHMSPQLVVACVWPCNCI